MTSVIWFNSIYSKNKFNIIESYGVVLIELIVLNLCKFVWIYRAVFIFPSNLNEFLPNLILVDLWNCIFTYLHNYQLK